MIKLIIRYLLIKNLLLVGKPVDRFSLADIDPVFDWIVNGHLIPINKPKRYETASDACKAA